MEQEWIAIVDENDNEIGTIERRDSVAQRQRVRVAFVYVIDPASRKIAISQRGADLTYQPLAWQPSAGGYVAQGESWDAAAARELQEELGITARLVHLATLSFADSFSDMPFVGGFYACAGNSTQLQADVREIADIKFLTLDEAEHLAQIQPAEQVHGAYTIGLKTLRENWDKVIHFVG